MRCAMAEKCEPVMTTGCETHVCLMVFGFHLASGCEIKVRVASCNLVFGFMAKAECEITVRLMFRRASCPCGIVGFHLTSA